MTDQPLGEAGFLVLTALADEPQHGYALIEEIARISDGHLRLRAGSLYAVLDRLRSAGLVEVDHEEVVNSRLRRYYRVTAPGLRRLASEAERMRRHARAAGQRLRRLGIAVAPERNIAPGTGVA
jgi:DNA-binding PadR family transcriptional regulator